MMELTLIQKITIWALPVIFAITLHEAAHGWMAKQFGDYTAQLQGRITLNPLKHIDPIGTILVPGLLLAIGGFVFGWAKAVPVNPRNFKQPKVAMAWVAIAGPAANLVMALLWLLVAKIGTLLLASHSGLGEFLYYSGLAGVTINLILLLLNLLPIPPLDGSRVVSAFLPPKPYYYYNRLEPYGFFILLGLLLVGALNLLLMAPYQATYHFLLSLIGL